MGSETILLIPHYGEIDFLIECLSSIENLLDKPEQILIFNNSAEDIHPIIWKEEMGDYLRVMNAPDQKNVGFTEAINKLLTWCNAAFFWILNNDAVVDPEALTSLLKVMRENPCCGIVSSYVYDYSNKDRLCFTGGGDIFPGVHRTDRSERPRKERWVSFCSVLIRLEMIIEIGLLDRNFFLICSDSDYCYTARSRGWDILSDPGSSVFHREDHGISRAQNIEADPKLKKRMIIDQRYFREKWLGSELFRDLNLEVFPGE